jgi:alkylation response protein AidB-like acyl-CoA dehydrogenase
MDTLLDADERAILESASQLLSAESPPSLARECEKDGRKHPAGLWSRIAAQGWCGLCLDEDVGGQGAPLNWMGLLLEAIGRHVSPLPLGTSTAASLIVSRFGNPAQREGLKRVAAGESILSYAVQEADGKWDLDSVRMTGRLDGDRLILNGSKCFVEGFEASDRVLVVFRPADGAMSGAVSLALIDSRAAGLGARPLVNTAKGDQSILDFREVSVPMSDLVGRWGEGRPIASRLMDVAAAFTASQMAGAAARATEMAVEYSRLRNAFGQPIGSFQALQHLAADMKIAVDGTELLVREALWRLQHDLPASLEVAQAKAFANQHCVSTCRSAQQIHGGIGFMMEFDLHLWYRRVVSWSLCAGTVSEHRKTIARLLLDAPGAVRLDDCHLPEHAGGQALQGEASPASPFHRHPIGDPAP